MEAVRKLRKSNDYLKVREMTRNERIRDLGMARKEGKSEI